MAHPFRIGLGTDSNDDPEQCAQSVQDALDVGYRHLDTAQLYGTESYVGEGLNRSPVPRSEVFVATKVLPSNMGYDDVIESTMESREKLGVETIDLLYVHWPIGEYDAAETIPAINELQDRGVVRHLGVSNYTTELLDEAYDVTRYPIFAHQVELHPLLHQEELITYAQEHGHWIVGYSPLVRGEVFDSQILTSVAEKHGVSAAQVSLAWLFSKDNVAAVPKATSREHIADNYGAVDLELDDEDIDRIDGIEQEKRLLREGNSTILGRHGGAPWT